AKAVGSTDQPNVAESQLEIVRRLLDRSIVQMHQLKRRANRCVRPPAGSFWRGIGEKIVSKLRRLQSGVSKSKCRIERGTGQHIVNDCQTEMHGGKAMVITELMREIS